MLLSVDDVCCGLGEDIKAMVRLRTQSTRVNVRAQLTLSVKLKHVVLQITSNKCTALTENLV